MYRVPRFLLTHKLETQSEMDEREIESVSDENEDAGVKKFIMWIFNDWNNDDENRTHENKDWNDERNLQDKGRHQTSS